MLDEDQRLGVLGALDYAESSLAAGCSVKLDFSGVEQFHPCGTLVFLARFDVWMHRYQGKVTGTYPDDPVTEQLLQHFKVLERLGLAPRQEVVHERVKFWHLKSGTTANAEAYVDLAQVVRSNIDHPEAPLFADCLNEAVANSVGHAYQFQVPTTPPEDLRKWWVLSQLKDDLVFVAIYDLGVTIPASLKRKPALLDFFRRRRYKDSYLIGMAVGTNRTRTGLYQRGKGLPEMLEFSKKMNAGSLSIASGYGVFEYNAETEIGRRQRFDCPVPGTLVLWKIPFLKERSNDKSDLSS